MREDKEALDFIWDNWESHDLTIDKLIVMAKEKMSEDTLSEIWHLISFKSMEKTAFYAKKAIEKGNEQSFVHDNLVFGYGLCNTDLKPG